MSMAFAAALACAAIGASERDELRAIVADAIADASARSSLIVNDRTHGGHDGAFFLGSDDEAFRLEISGYMQFRYIANLAGDRRPDEFTGGFTNRRTRLTFRGHVIDPSLTFKLSADVSWFPDGVALIRPLAVVVSACSLTFAVPVGADLAGARNNLLKKHRLRKPPISQKTRQ